MSILLWYLLAGIVIPVILTIDLLVAIHGSGYDVLNFLFWVGESDLFKYPNTGIAFKIFEFAWGVMMWPVRVLEYNHKVDLILDQYVKHINNLKEE